VNDLPRVAVVGAGPAGAVAGLALAAAGIPARLLDARARGAWRHDRRALALSWASRLTLDRCGVWSRIARVDPIERVSVSERGMFGALELHADELGLPALGYVVDYADLADACAAALEAAGVEVVYERPVRALTPARSGVLVEDATCAWHAGWVLLADGAESVEAGRTLRRSERAYRQVALVRQVDCPGLAEGLACERFPGRGALALLPRAGMHACVWAMPEADAGPLLEASVERQSQALSAVVEAVAGRCRWQAPPRGLALSLARTRVSSDSRVIPIGNASQALHPVAGQGLNLALRDAWSIARDWPLAGGEAAERRHLAARIAGRGLDRTVTVSATDALARLTMIDWLPLRMARGLGIAALDAVPAVRRRLLSTLVFGA